MSDTLDKLALPALLTIGSGLQMTHFARKVGQCRLKVGLKYPETNGPEEFNRCFRAQQNCVEFYPTALGVFWVASAFAHPVPASVLFTGYMVGRHRYFNGYCESTQNRLPGFYMSVRCLMGLLALATAGAGNSLLRQYADIDLAKLVWEHLPILKGD